MKSLILSFLTIMLLLEFSSKSFAQANNLKFDKMIYIADSAQTCCSAGYIWEIQSILNTYEDLTKSLKEKILIQGGWFYPVSFPFFISSEAKISSGDKNRIIVVAQYKVE